MQQAATFYIVHSEGLQKLHEQLDTEVTSKKSLFKRRKPGEILVEMLDLHSTEKNPYKWSGLAYSMLAMFCKEKMGFDWSGLEYHQLANKLSEKYASGVYIFCVKDEGLFRLEANGFFYTLEELEQFAIDLLGSRPSNPEIMNEAVKMFNMQMAKLKKDNAVVLLLQ